MPDRRKSRVLSLTRGERACLPARPTGCPAHLASLAVAAVVGAVLVQHALFLEQRIADGSLSDPWVLGRWVVGLVLTGAMLALRRAGLSLVRGRQAAIFWLAVVVFHFVVAAAPSGLGASPAALLPGTSPVLAFALVCAVSLGARAGTARFGARNRGGHAGQALSGRPRLLPLAARPPPAAA